MLIPRLAYIASFTNSTVITLRVLSFHSAFPISYGIHPFYYNKLARPLKTGRARAISTENYSFMNLPVPQLGSGHGKLKIRQRLHGSPLAGPLHGTYSRTSSTAEGRLNRILLCGF